MRKPKGRPRSARSNKRCEVQHDPFSPHLAHGRICLSCTLERHCICTSFDRPQPMLCPITGSAQSRCSASMYLDLRTRSPHGRLRLHTCDKVVHRYVDRPVGRRGRGAVGHGRGEQTWVHARLPCPVHQLQRPTERVAGATRMLASVDTAGGERCAVHGTVEQSASVVVGPQAWKLGRDGWMRCGNPAAPERLSEPAASEAAELRLDRLLQHPRRPEAPLPPRSSPPLATRLCD